MFGEGDFLEDGEVPDDDQITDDDQISDAESPRKGHTGDYEMLEEGNAPEEGEFLEDGEVPEDDEMTDIDSTRKDPPQPALTAYIAPDLSTGLFAKQLHWDSTCVEKSERLARCFRWPSMHSSQKTAEGILSSAFLFGVLMQLGLRMPDSPVLISASLLCFTEVQPQNPTAPFHQFMIKDGTREEVQTILDLECGTLQTLGGVSIFSLRDLAILASADDLPKPWISYRESLRKCVLDIEARHFHNVCTLGEHTPAWSEQCPNTRSLWLSRLQRQCSWLPTVPHVGYLISNIAFSHDGRGNFAWQLATGATAAALSNPVLCGMPSYFASKPGSDAPTKVFNRDGTFIYEHVKHAGSSTFPLPKKNQNSAHPCAAYVDGEVLCPPSLGHYVELHAVLRDKATGDPLALLVGNISQSPYIMLSMDIEKKLVLHPETCAYFNVRTLLLPGEAAQSLHTGPFPRADHIELLHQWPVHQFRPRQHATTSELDFVVEFVAVRGEGSMFQPVIDSDETQMRASMNATTKGIWEKLLKAQTVRLAVVVSGVYARGEFEWFKRLIGAGKTRDQQHFQSMWAYFDGEDTDLRQLALRFLETDEAGPQSYPKVPSYLVKSWEHGEAVTLVKLKMPPQYASIEQLVAVFAIGTSRAIQHERLEHRSLIHADQSSSSLVDQLRALGRLLEYVPLPGTFDLKAQILGQSSTTASAFAAGDFFSIATNDPALTPELLQMWYESISSPLDDFQQSPYWASLHGLTSSYGNIHGPPGTGKSLTAACIIAAVAATKKVLVVAQTNDCLDDLLNKLLAILRQVPAELSPIRRSIAVCRYYSRSAQQTKPSLCVFKDPPENSKEIKSGLHDYLFGDYGTQMASPVEVPTEAHSETDFAAGFDSARQKLSEQLLARMNIVFATIDQSASLVGNFDSQLVILEECNQVNLPQAIKPLVQDRRPEALLMIGDTMQLGPVVPSALIGFNEMAAALTKPFAEHLQRFEDTQCFALGNNYRNPASIWAFPRGQYKKTGVEVESAVKVENIPLLRRLSEAATKYGAGFLRGVLDQFDLRKNQQVWFDTMSCTRVPYAPIEDQSPDPNPRTIVTHENEHLEYKRRYRAAKVNYGGIATTCRTVRDLLDLLKVDPADILVQATTADDAEALERCIRRINPDVAVKTVNKFLRGESTIVVTHLGACACSPDKDARQNVPSNPTMNVALTRATAFHIIIGNAACIQKNIKLQVDMGVGDQGKWGIETCGPWVRGFLQHIIENDQIVRYPANEEDKQLFVDPELVSRLSA
ncbi:hypothetical protein KC356_g2137 [Hortaea werneckii]|nr:hypothetical protein KC356_g2137 [Hortaea werneckii]